MIHQHMHVRVADIFKLWQYACWPSKEFSVTGRVDHWQWFAGLATLRMKSAAVMITPEPAGYAQHMLCPQLLCAAELKVHNVPVGLEFDCKVLTQVSTNKHEHSAHEGKNSSVRRESSDLRTLNDSSTAFDS